MNIRQSSSNKVEYDTLSLLSQHMYRRHRNIFLGFGTVIFMGLTSFVILRNYTYHNRDHLAKIRREIQNVTPGSESVFEEYHKKLKRRQAEKELQQQLAKG